MTKCPNCKEEVEKPDKTWKYGIFTVNAYFTVLSSVDMGAIFTDFCLWWKAYQIDPRIEITQGQVMAFGFAVETYLATAEYVF